MFPYATHFLGLYTLLVRISSKTQVVQTREVVIHLNKRSAQPSLAYKPPKSQALSQRAAYVCSTFEPPGACSLHGGGLPWGRLLRHLLAQGLSGMSADACWR